MTIANQWIEALWRASWQGALAVMAVAAVCLAFKRLPFAVRNTLWWLVFAKMLLSLSPASVALPVGGASRTVPVATTVTPRAIRLPQLRAEPAQSLAALERAPTQAPPREAPTWQTFLAGAWILGAAVSALFSLAALAKAFQAYARAEPCREPALLETLRQAAAQAGLIRTPHLRISKKAIDVITLGFFRPAILLPQNVQERCSQDELAIILAHECIHIRRADPQLGIIPQIAQIVFFFHPLVWLAAREFNFTREAACDQAAMTAAQIGPDRYGRLLLALGVRQGGARPLCLPGVSSHFQLLRRRIAMLNQISSLPVFRPNRSLVAAMTLTALLFALPFSLVQGRPSDTATPVETSATKTAALKTKAVKKTALKKAPGPSLYTPATEGKTPAKPAGGTMTVFSLQYAKAAEATTLLRQAYKRPDLSIVADPRTNSVLILGTKSEIAEVSGALTNLDQPSAQQQNATPRETKLYRLMYAKADVIADELRSTVATRGAVSIGVDQRTNSLIVAADSKNMGTIAQLLRELDVPPTQAVYRRVYVKVWKAEDIARIIAGPLMKLGIFKNVDITIDTVTNSLIVTGSEDDIIQVQLMVNLFDVKKGDL